MRPSQKRLQAWRDAGADPDQRPKPTYKLVSVYAQDQGAALPPPAKPVPLRPPIAEITGDSHERLFGAVVSLAEQIGYSRRRDDRATRTDDARFITRPASIR